MHKVLIYTFNLNASVSALRYAYYVIVTDFDKRHGHLTRSLNKK